MRGEPRVPGGSAEHEHASRGGALEPEREAQQRRLAAAVRPGDPDERPVLDGERDALERGRTAPIGERDVLELDRGNRAHVHPRAARSAARFWRITLK